MNITIIVLAEAGKALIVMSYHFQSSIRQIQHSLAHNNLPVPDEVAAQCIANRADKRVICHIQGVPTFHCALLPDGKGHYYILLNKERKAIIQKQDTIEVQLEPDHSKFGMSVPEEFEEVLQTDPEGAQYFLNLTAGKQRSLLHLIAKIKSVDLKIEKSLIIMAHLKKMKGTLEHKILRDDFRRGYSDELHL